MNQNKKQLWEIAEESNSKANSNANPDPHLNSLIKDRIAALALLKDCYKESLEAFVGGSISEMSAIRHVRDLEGEGSYDAMIQNDPSLMDLVKIGMGEGKEKISYVD
jgi:hypothetical protein